MEEKRGFEKKKTRVKVEMKIRKELTDLKSTDLAHKSDIHGGDVSSLFAPSQSVDKI